MHTRHAEVELLHVTSFNTQGKHQHSAYSPPKDWGESKTQTHILQTQILPSILPGVPSFGQNKSRGVKRGSIKG